MHIDDVVLTLVAQGDYDAAAWLPQSRQGVPPAAAAAEIDRLRQDITPLESGISPTSDDPITPPSPKPSEQAARSRSSNSTARLTAWG